MKSLSRFVSALLLAMLAMPVFPQLIAGGDTTICQGGQAQLSATGGGASYYWSSVPFDPSLLIPQQQNPIVAPQVTTMYVVQSNIATGNLILNGSFELGVMGFSSDYVNNQVSIQAEGTYAVVTDAHTVHPNFFCNQDHTSGSGKFMAVNGSGVPNVRVWYLNIPSVQPHHQYEFSTWITSLHSTNPALLQFSINGTLVAEPFQAYSSTCDWYQFYYVWESGENTSANISIVNQNTILSGNDFALDDISFATVTVHYDTVWVTVLPQYNSLFTAPADACAQETITVEYTGNAPETADYHWDFDGATVISGSGQGPYEILFVSMGNHSISLYVTGEGCPSDTTELPLLIGESPAVAVTADATLIPYGTGTVLHGAYSGGQGPYDYYWEPASSLLDPALLDPQTNNLTATTEFTLFVTDQSAQCTGFESITIQVTGGPLGVNATASPAVVCPGEAVLLEALTSGGTGNYAYLWTSVPAGFTSDLASPTVVPEQTTTYHVTVDDGLSVVEGLVTVTVNPKPLANAGTDQTVPYGTSTSLSGTSTGGSGNYSWHWSPPEWLVSTNQQNPYTLNITEAVVFTLTVTDNQTGCTSDPDQVVVTPEGGPLAVAIQAEAQEICEGTDATLLALTSGGNQGSYTYTWTDDQGNSYPSANSISVSPVQTTTYFVSVWDGFNTSTDAFTLTVFPAADFTLAGGQQTIYVCPYDTVVLVPSPNPSDWSYLWSNGSVNDSIFVGSTGIGFDMKTFTLQVESANGCVSSQEITVIFDFGNCFGIEEHARPLVRVYPNPGSGKVHISWEEGFVPGELRIFNTQMQVVYQKEVNIPSSQGHGLTEDFSSLVPGVYILQLAGQKGNASVSLVIMP